MITSSCPKFAVEGSTNRCLSFIVVHDANLKFGHILTWGYLLGEHEHWSKQKFSPRYPFRGMETKLVSNADFVNQDD